MITNRWRWLVFGSAIVVLVVVAALWSQLSTIESGGWERVVFCCASFGAMIVAAFSFPNLGKRAALITIIVSATLVRLAYWQAPVSDDVNRYLWEGRLVAVGQNPYLTIADDESLANYRDSYWEKMNHRDRATAYPPGMLLITAFTGKISYTPNAMKALALVGDFAVLALLAAFLSRTASPMRWLCFWAFNPIVLASYAAEAHFDSWMIAGLLAAILQAQRGRAGWAWVWLAFAIQMKLMVIIVAPFFLLTLGWRQLWVFALALLAPALPFLFHLDKMVLGLLAFGGESAFNGGLYEGLVILGASPTGARIILAALFFGFYAAALLTFWKRCGQRSANLFENSFLVLATPVLASPIIHLWYLSWLIPLLVLRPSLSLLSLALPAACTYFAWQNQENGNYWGYAPGYVIASWIPFFTLLLLELRRASGRLKPGLTTTCKLPQTTPPSIALIIPCYAVGKSLRQFLPRLREASPQAARILIIDGHPEAKDAALARELGFETLNSERGRGQQIAVGFKHCSEDLIAIIHSDTTPQVDWLTQILKADAAHPTAAAFALGQRFDISEPKLLLVEALNEARATLGGSVFGDQTLIVRREILTQAGGFPAQPLMEDVEVSWRLRSLGRIHYLGEEWQVSAKKWEGRFKKRFGLVVSLLFRYWLARLRSREAAGTYSQKLYLEYYR